MANDLPNDVRKSLEESGVKFDKDGNILEEPSFIENEEVEEESEEVEDTESEEDEVEETEDTDEEESEEDEEESEDDDDEDEEEEVELTPSKSKNKLTKKSEKTKKKSSLTPKKEKEDTSETERLRKEIEELKSLLTTNKTEIKKEEKSSLSATEETLRQEVEAFKRNRMLDLANRLRSDVNRKFSNHGISYDDVINSQEWSDFQGSMKYGNPIGKYYTEAVKSGDYEAIVGFFDDFKSIYIPEEEKITTEKVKPSLDDLVVPEKSKSSSVKKKRAKYDFKASDYAEMLNKFERGRITQEEFFKFDEKYIKSEAEGRVKPD